LPFSRLRKTLPKPKYQFFDEPQTLGDKIRKRRLELGLLQKDVAAIIGVCEETITLWEGNRAQPLVTTYPKIIEFLSYFPFDIDTSSFVGKIKNYRFRLGLSQVELAKRLGVNESTVFHYEKETHKPDARKLKILETLLNKV